MINKIDIAFLIDGSLSMSFHLNPIRNSILSTLRRAQSIHSESVRMASILFQSHDDNWRTRSYPFTSSIDTFQQWLPSGPLTGDNSDEKKAIVDALAQALLLDWSPNNSNNQYREKLVILITDGSPCNLLSSICRCDSADLWQMGDKYATENITLVVLGIEPTVICDAFYCALAKKTGGEYLPFINGARVLPDLVSNAILGGNTLRQLLRRLDVRMDIERDSLYSYSTALKWAEIMYKECYTLADIRKTFYPYLDRFNQRSISSVPIENSDSDPSLDPSSPPSCTNYINLWSNPLSSTNDEGYRSRLSSNPIPINTNLFDRVYLQPSSNSLELNSDSEVDDGIVFGNDNLESPIVHGYLLEPWRAGNHNMFSSTPVTDDEGYRTRLPTAASVDTSFTYVGSLQLGVNPVEFHSDGDVDNDDVFQ